MPDELCAAAAAWMAQLHDEQRGPEMEGRLQAWLDESESHRRAFRRMERAWARAGEIRMRARGEDAVARPRARFAWRSAALAATLVLGAMAVVYCWRDTTAVTRVGQQQVRLLSDGTRVLLNTDTRIEVNYDDHARRVRLVRGEAWFDVAHRPTWPFLVSVEGEEIRALGTSFIVRDDDTHDLSVILVEGRISVAPIAGNGAVPSQPPQIMVPGQRLTLSDHHAPAIDRPELARVTAWKRGQVAFDETPLEEAADEMNRYSTSRIVIADAEAARMRIGGVFRAGDSEEFVRIVTAAFGLRADRKDGETVLSAPAGEPEK